MPDFRRPLALAGCPRDLGSAGLTERAVANFEGLVLGCIEAGFSKKYAACFMSSRDGKNLWNSIKSRGAQLRIRFHQ